MLQARGFAIFVSTAPQTVLDGRITSGVTAPRLNTNAACADSAQTVRTRWKGTFDWIITAQANGTARAASATRPTGEESAISRPSGTSKPSLAARGGKKKNTKNPSTGKDRHQETRIHPAHQLCPLRPFRPNRHSSPILRRNLRNDEPTMIR